MRRPWLVGPLFLVLCTTVAIAGDNVANTSQKGSVHVFPYVVADANRTTFIRLANEGPGDIDVHCEFRDDNDVRGGFVTTIKRRQASWFDVSGGVASVNMPYGPYPENENDRVFLGEGELVCWAVDEGDTTQVRWNHVFATATLVDYTTNTLFEYPSWAFQARQGIDKGQVGPKPGEILLDGTYYDACPTYLHGVRGDGPDAPPGGGGGGGDGTLASVIVTPCVFDVRQDRDPFSTKLHLDNWDSTGTVSSTFDQCGDFWNRLLLPAETGQFAVSALQNGSCSGSVSAGIVGVFYRPGDTVGGGSGLAGSGSKAGKILWVPSETPE